MSTPTVEVCESKEINAAMATSVRDQENRAVPTIGDVPTAEVRMAAKMCDKDD